MVILGKSAFSTMGETPAGLASHTPWVRSGRGNAEKYLLTGTVQTVLDDANEVVRIIGLWQEF